jgi:hypothetical protein
MTDTYQFKGPSREAMDYADAITIAIEMVSKRHASAGKPILFMDPMSALLGVLGSFVAGTPEAVRSDVLSKCDRLLRIAVEQALEQHTGQKVTIGAKQ